MLSQPRVIHSEVIPAPVDDVWDLLRRFDTIDEWHPGITDCSIEEGRGSDQVGAVRNFQAGDRTLREKLVAHSDLERYHRYTILQGGGAKEDYLSDLRAIPITESNETLVVWTGDFDAPSDEMANEKEGLSAVYTGGLQGIRQEFE